jgi:hypothetical protein
MRNIYSAFNQFKRAFKRTSPKAVLIFLTLTALCGVLVYKTVLHSGDYVMEETLSMLPFTSPTDYANHSGGKTLVIYAYFEKNELYAKTLDYFIKLGVEPSDRIDYVFIIQGYRSSIEIPMYRNVRVLRRPNTCFDFGAYGKAIEWMGGIARLRGRYANFVFINPSALGPILPKYWPRWIHWTEVFTSRLVNDTHACSTSIVCLPKTDLGGWGPRIEGLFRMLFLNHKNCHQKAFSRKDKPKNG